MELTVTNRSQAYPEKAEKAEDMETHGEECLHSETCGDMDESLRSKLNEKTEGFRVPAFDVSGRVKTDGKNVLYVVLKICKSIFIPR